MKTVYTCFATDVIHAGHLNIINEAKKYGRVVVGCLSDRASIRYNRFPTVPEDKRIQMYREIEGHGARCQAMADRQGLQNRDKPYGEMAQLASHLYGQHCERIPSRELNS